jgi:hypothetical protein
VQEILKKLDVATYYATNRADDSQCPLIIILAGIRADLLGLRRMGSV